MIGRAAPRALLVLLVASALAACTKTAITAPVESPTPGSAVGYVRMNDLIKHHPLYAQLSGYDDSIEALNLDAVVPHVAKPSAAIVAQEAALQRELAAAATHTRTLIAQKSQQYQAREQAAIAVALRSIGTHAPSVSEITRQIDATATTQAANVSAQASRDFDTYRRTLATQDTSELRAQQQALADRAEREYRAKADELSAKESALSLQLTEKDAAARLSLRTRLSSLALDDAQRDDAKAQLAALDRSEADALAAMKNRDAQTLSALGATLRAGVQRDMRSRADELHARSIAKLQSRSQEIRTQFAPGSIAVAPIPAAGGSSSALTPRMRATIAALHREYQARFEADAKATIADFNRTRIDLSQRYAQLRGIDAGAQRSTDAELAELAKKRSDLYGQMVAQIGREVRLLARERGISVVVTDPVANAGGIDLTADAMKDIESLHE